MTVPFYSLIAGANGVGKTSLYQILRNQTDLGKRVNTDEIVAEYGDWQNSLFQVHAGRIAMQRLDDYIQQQICFHQETTTLGVTVGKLVRRAKENGYQINLYYVGLDEIAIAIDRVHKRVQQGGHGIDDKVIIQRYVRLQKNLLLLLPLCDQVVFYDNTTRFRQVGVMLQGEWIDCDYDVPRWMRKLIPV